MRNELATMSSSGTMANAAYSQSSTLAPRAADRLASTCAVAPRGGAVTRSSCRVALAGMTLIR